MPSYLKKMIEEKDIAGLIDCGFIKLASEINSSLLATELPIMYISNTLVTNQKKTA